MGCGVRRFRGVVVLVLAVALLGAARAPGRLGARRAPGSAAKVCARARKAFAQIGPPGTLVDAQTGLDRWLRGNYSAQIPKGLPRLRADVGDLEMDLGNVDSAVANGDGPTASDAVRRAGVDLDAIDREATSADVAACASGAFGRAYVEGLGLLITTELALTGDFATDANAACARFSRSTNLATQGLHPSDLQDPDTLSNYVGGFVDALTALREDFAAITPPRGQQQPVSSFEATLDQTIQQLGQAAPKLSSGPPSQVTPITDQLDAVTRSLTTDAAAFGVDC